MAEDTEGNEGPDDAVDPTGIAPGDGSAEASGEDAETPGTPETAETAGAAETAESPRLEVVEDAEAGGTGQYAGPGFEESAKEFISSVENFVDSLLKDASEVVDKMTAKERESTGEQRRRPADPAQFLDSVEGWLGDYFRGGPVGKAAAGFGRAAAGSALRSAARSEDDVWASATVEETHGDASRECRYCPFCQTLAAVRNTRPELYEQIGDTARRLVDLVRQAAEQSTGRRPWR